MNIKAIRKYANLTQKEFAAKYRIPLQTLKHWESSPESSSYRKPPDYVLYMLDQLVTLESLREDEHKRLQYKEDVQHEQKMEV